MYLNPVYLPIILDTRRYIFILFLYTLLHSNKKLDKSFTAYTLAHSCPISSHKHILHNSIILSEDKNCGFTGSR